MLSKYEAHWIFNVQRLVRFFPLLEFITKQKQIITQTRTFTMTGESIGCAPRKKNKNKKESKVGNENNSDLSKAVQPSKTTRGGLRVYKIVVLGDGGVGKSGNSMLLLMLVSLLPTQCICIIYGSDVSSQSDVAYVICQYLVGAQLILRMFPLNWYSLEQARFI